MKKFVSTFVVLLVIWLFMTSFNLSEFIVGLLVSIVLAGVISRLVDYEFDFSVVYKVPLFVIVYVPFFVCKMFLSNIDVARRVLTPKIPLNPGFVKIPVDLKGDVGKLTLANSVTLTPGTLSVDADDENLYIHWIDIKGENEKDYKKHVTATFEKILGRIYK
ncbi:MULTISPECIES: Na+/H+ antiporter subunit E [Petrotoga]|uniref:Membrane bound protein complex subunit mbxA n=2 Tax=Petrotoga sibirica TaxID=156202 RepID=A0A4R8EXP8_9BACT|nr:MULTISPECIES: Na+/H+ antiporter subunit E [Petrotoga]KUK81138.1 MAG: Cation antiporter [Petrotoga mobilis]POZ88752.1 cation:proton antiporter [Petrotoga sibirica DSM 13575]POZ90875.1 cation:proton antiporter [Petrotoga sp. SL27]TDX17359.1 Membrane bound protein complex subunit mbxA [Petrotoga sibirica]